MASLLSRLTDDFASAFAELGLDPSFGEVVPSNRPDLGQFQVNGALPAAKTARTNPRELAARILEHVPHRERYAELSIAGPGFINITLDDGFLAEHVGSFAGDERLGIDPVARPERTVIDFGGPNVAKAMHVGHLRSSVIGDSLQRLLRFLGHDVVSDIHLGDWGLPMGMLIMELRRRRPDLPYFDPDATGPFPEEPPVTLEDLQEMYPQAAARCAEDPAAAEEARQATLELQSGRPGYVALWRHFVAVSVAALERDFDDLGIGFDLWYGESTVHDRIAPMIDRLRAAGVAEESDGAIVIHVQEPDDDREIPPLVLVKSDGGYLYGTTDLATIEQRVEELGAERILYVVDNRQSLHFEQVFRAARKGGIAPPDLGLEHIGFGTVNGPDGRPFKTRAGGVLRLRDLIEMVREAAAKRLAEADIAQDYPAEERARIAHQVGVAALKFGDLRNHRTSDYIFDLDRFTAFEGKTGPYLQYSAVRIRSILRNATEHGYAPGPVVAPDRDAERDLMIHLALIPEAVHRAADGRAPNHIAEHTYELAARLNRFYESCHILREPDPARRASWLSLVATTLTAFELLLGLLGIEVPDRM